MQIKDSTYISYGGKPAREAWYEGTLVWQASSFSWVMTDLDYGTWTDIEYCDNGTLIAVGNNRYSYSTNNGDNWATTISPINPAGSTETYNALACGPDHMWVITETRAYAPYGSGNFYTTFDPATGLNTYTFSDPLSTLGYSDLVYSSYHGKYIAIGSKEARYTNDIVGMYSTDGINWLSANYVYYSGSPGIDNQGFTGGMVEGTDMPNHRLVASGVAGAHKLGYSDDGITWYQGAYASGNSPLGQNLQSGCQWTDVTYGNSASLPLSGRYVASNLNGSTTSFPFAYSDDGIGWIGVETTGSVINKNWKSIIFGNGYFVASDGDGYQAMSKDGINWTVYQNVPTTGQLQDICIANNRFVAVVYQGSSTGSAVADFIF